jgi:hypothetical protein
MPFRDEVFTQVTAIAVMEHVNDPSQVLTEIFRVSKKRGTFKILVPADSRMLFNYVIYFFTFQFRTLIGQYRAIRQGIHKWQYSVSSLKMLCSRHGFNVICVYRSSPYNYGDVSRRPALQYLMRLHEIFPVYKPHLIVECTKNCVVPKEVSII